jgi:formylglycine-generating enzyme required for sulfatase activity
MEIASWRQNQRYPWGDDESLARDYANYGSNVGTTTVAGSYAANGYGLYDVASNVEEWCADWYHADYYKESLVKNPPGPDTGSIDVWGPDSG